MMSEQSTVVVKFSMAQSLNRSPTVRDKQPHFQALSPLPPCPNDNCGMGNESLGTRLRDEKV